jgi:hypothetical protein
LQELIRTALKQNYDLQMAVERASATRAQLGIARSNQFPVVTLDPVFSDGKPTRTSSPAPFRSLVTSSSKLTLGRYRRAVLQQRLIWYKLGKYSMRPTLRFPISNGKSARRKTRSTFGWESIRTMSLAANHSASRLLLAGIGVRLCRPATHGIAFGTARVQARYP